MAVPVALATRADSAETAVSPFEEALLGKINSVRRQVGARPLRIVKGLMVSATAHARSMAKGGYFGHSSADGSSASSRIRRHYDGNTVGETMLWRSPGVSPAAAIRLWLASPSHRAIVLSGRFRDVGLAAIHLDSGSGSFGGGPVTIVVADFGAR
jgi:uncharacterized protein YkwD